MNTKTIGALAVVAMLFACGVARADVFYMGFGLTSLETASVGNPGNAADMRYAAVGDPYYGNGVGFGKVDYAYNIGKYEVTAGQYCEFLNKVAAADPYGLYCESMGNPEALGCNIQRSGESGGYTYSVAADWANRPVNYVNYWDSCRFANWLGNGQPSGQQGPGTTETGAYTLAGYTGDDGRDIQRNAAATWAVTSEDEWYKAAYYKGGSADAGYWDYPTRSDAAPGNDMADVQGNNANFYTGSGPYPIDDGKRTTVVGQFWNSPSAYGTSDQGGNLWEWNEAITYQDSDYVLRGLRGGSFGDGAFSLNASYRNGEAPSFDYGNFGFRVSQMLAPAALPHDGDTNNDGAVNVVDLGVLAKYYDSTGLPHGNHESWGLADFDDNGAVNVVDLGVLAKNYDWVDDPIGSVPSVPEPASMTLLALGALALLRRKSGQAG